MNRKNRISEPQYSTVLREYRENLEKVRLLGLESHLSEKEIHTALDQYMRSCIVKKSIPKRKIFKSNLFLYLTKFLHFCKKSILVFFSFLVIMMILYIILQHKPIQYFIQSKLQDFIYPGMKTLRKLFLPIISWYPALTHLYDESCLVVNPFFRVPDMSCPCDDVRVVLNATSENVHIELYHSGIPFLVKVEREEVSWDTLEALYQNHSSVFDRDAAHLTISSPAKPEALSSPASIFSSDWDATKDFWDCVHLLWRLNRMEPTRLLRSIFGSPDYEPIYAAGVTIEKLVFADGPKAPAYNLPTTEGTTVFIYQASGSRIFVLNPASECKDICTSVSVELPPNHILWFSWWYWRATSLPSPGTSSMSISYAGSYM